MDDTIGAEERAYWVTEVHRRSLDCEACRAHGNAPYLLAAAQLRLNEAEERLLALQRRGDVPLKT